MSPQKKDENEEDSIVETLDDFLVLIVLLASCGLILLIARPGKVRRNSLLYPLFRRIGLYRIYGMDS